MITDKESSAGNDAAPLQPTPRVDKFALRNNDLLDLARQLERDYAGIRRKLILERELRENAEQSYTDCKATLADERYCHGQSIVSLKQAASEEIKAANERGDIDEMVPASLAREFEAHCEAMALFADDHWPGCECAGCTYLAWKAKRIG